MDDGEAAEPAERQVPAVLGRRRLLAAAGAGTVAALITAGTGQAAIPAPAGRRAAAPAAPGGPRLLHIGTYTGDGGGTGLGLARYDPDSGLLTGAAALTGVANPSFLAVSASGGTLYAVDEQPAGAVTAVSVDADGNRRVLGSQPTGGSGPCHLSAHPGGGYLLTANYDSGSVAVHPLAADGGLLPRTDLVQHTGAGPDPDRQDGPHAHMVLSDPDGGYVLAVDLGTDTVYTYRLDEAAGRLAAVSQARVRPGSGPRHLAFHPSARFAYLANELGDSVVVCGYDPATGTVSPGQPQPTVPPGSPAGDRNYPAEVVVSADGAFVYVSNRGHDSVARFAVEEDGAALRLLETVPAGGAYPRHIAFDPTGTLLFAANQNSGTVTVFHVDQDSGALTPTGTAFATPMPVCVLPG
ncbi:lactonase family protein [Actinacidiphila sp. ITFR-21]|uniref:lactonase family protein n=1 Tax=Actinacidiphila sp. ITFR-21 TaxID=3075199 RepID=UPI00288ABBFF|nr:lactonase family protein [Streptomyces sp. ITFR-21]WNI14358.1 lactonase family protein [Streptomyces sp. ITFR-21]